jgi:AcrR family transcriptional regulator
MTSSAPDGAAARRPMRADARRNYQRLVAAAAAAFAEHGTDASMDDIARRAGVGPGTLYRHFPTRHALLEAVYRDQVEALCARAYELGDTLPPGEALAAWLRAVAGYVTTKRGLAEALMSGPGERQPEVFAAGKQAMREAGAALVGRAQEAGEVRGDVDVADLLKLGHAIALAAEHAPDGPDQADRLLALVMDGLRQGRPLPTGLPAS